MIAPAICSRATRLLVWTGSAFGRVTARKIPHLGTLLGTGQFLAIIWTTAPAQTPDSASLVRRAQRAVAAYESAVRAQAPITFGPLGSSYCDEEIGRFCITFDPGHDSLPSEPLEVRHARDTAIARLGQAAERLPGRNTEVFPLLRYLVQAGRAEEAVPIARAYARATPDRADGDMAIGFALHYARRTTEAAGYLDSWMRALPGREQQKMRDLDWLLAGPERRRYAKMEQPARGLYEEIAWRYADPLFLTPGNELWTDHLARYAAGRMLRVRRSTLTFSWGQDLEQLTVRFGEPVLTTRLVRSGSAGLNQYFSEHWDQTQRTYFPPQPDSALVMHPRVDSIWPLDSIVARSGHAPPTIRRMRVLEHQAAVFGNQLRIIGTVPTDPQVQKPLTAAVFLLDSAFNIIARTEAQNCGSCLPADSAMLFAEVPLPDGARYYSAEVYDSTSRFAARARYRLERPDGLLSSIVLTQPFEPGQLPESRASARLEPLSRPVIAAGQRFGLYAEVDNRSRELRSVSVEVEVAGLDRGSALTRAAGWVGNTLGLTSPRSPARLGWNVELEADGITAVPVTLDLGTLKPGTYRVTMRMDEGTGSGGVVSIRDFMVVSSPSSSSPQP